MKHARRTAWTDLQDQETQALADAMRRVCAVLYRDGLDTQWNSDTTDEIAAIAEPFCGALKSRGSHAPR